MPAYVPKPEGDPTAIFRGLIFLIGMLLFFVIFFLSLSVLINNFNSGSNSEPIGPYAQIVSSLNNFFSFSSQTTDTNSSSDISSSSSDNSVITASYFSLVVHMLKNAVYHCLVFLILCSPYIVLIIIFVSILCLMLYNQIIRAAINYHITKLHLKIHNISLKLMELKNHPQRHGIAHSIYEIRINRLDAQLRIAQIEMEGYYVLLKRLDKNKRSQNSKSK